MNLNKLSNLKRFGRLFAKPMSRMICSNALLPGFRLLDAYLCFLQGKGAGTGWDLGSEIKAAVANIHRSDPIVFDIGANIGSWAESILSACPDAKLYMFEPSPYCQDKIRQLQLGSAVLVPNAVGSECSSADLHFSSPTDGSASLHDREDTCFADHEYQTVRVEVIDLDSFINRQGIGFVDFMKMDIEGHELFALKGAASAIREGRIGALTFEFGSGNINSRTYFKDFWKLLSSAGYSISRVTPSGKLIPISEYYEDLEYFRGVTNYVAALTNHPFRNSR